MMFRVQLQLFGVGWGGFLTLGLSLSRTPAAKQPACLRHQLLQLHVCSLSAGVTLLRCCCLQLDDVPDRRPRCGRGCSPHMRRPGSRKLCQLLVQALGAGAVQREVAVGAAYGSRGLPAGWPQTACVGGYERPDARYLTCSPSRPGRYVHPVLGWPNLLQTTCSEV